MKYLNKINDIIFLTDLDNDLRVFLVTFKMYLRSFSPSSFQQVIHSEEMSDVKLYYDNFQKTIRIISILLIIIIII